MGTSGSKAVQKAAGSAARKYPIRTPGTAPTPPTLASSTPSSVPPTESSFRSLLQPSQQQASTSKSKAIELDSRDPHLDASLRTIGPVTPNHAFSPSEMSSQASGSLNFPSPRESAAIKTLDARSRIQGAAEQEKIDIGKKDFEGRQFLDIPIIRKVLALRDEQGMSNKDIEQALKLKRGTVDRLGVQGVIEGA